MLEDDVPEMQDVVIETYSMSAEDWRRTRAFSWMTAFLYFDKLVQIPIIVLHQLSGVSYRKIFESFMSVDREIFPVIGEIRDFFLSEAESIQDGGVEYVYSEDWLGVYWPADEYIYIKLTVENQFQSFYSEIHQLFSELFCDALKGESANIMCDALTINNALISQPNFDIDIEVRLRYNIIDFWKSVCEGQPIPLVKGDYTHQILRSQRSYCDLQGWCKEVVWWGNKIGAYLYPVSVEKLTPPNGHTTNLAGHY